jgi:hypothetical protein
MTGTNRKSMDYHSLYKDAPETPPFGAASAPWLAAFLAKFGDKETTDAAEIARSVDQASLEDTDALIAFLDGIWDLVTKARDRNHYTDAQTAELDALAGNLGDSV